MAQKDTMSGISDVILGEEKQHADISTNVIPVIILNRRSPIKEYRYNDFDFIIQLFMILF